MKIFLRMHLGDYGLRGNRLVPHKGIIRGDEHDVTIVTINGESVVLFANDVYHPINLNFINTLDNTKTPVENIVFLNEKIAPSYMSKISYKPVFK